MPPPAWPSLLRAHAALTRRMDSALREHHGLRLNEFEVLLQLSFEDDARLRRVDLSRRLLITQGGITRMLAGLEKQGLVCRSSCDTDARVVYAQLTEAGRAKLESALSTHLADIRSLFSDRFSADELDRLGHLLSRLAEDGGDAAS
jgi:DNA-binding MarR family transcriptional regulator